MTLSNLLSLALNPILPLDSNCTSQFQHVLTELVSERACQGTWTSKSAYQSLIAKTFMNICEVPDCSVAASRHVSKWISQCVGRDIPPISLPHSGYCSTRIEDGQECYKTLALLNAELYKMDVMEDAPMVEIMSRSLLCHPCAIHSIHTIMLDMGIIEKKRSHQVLQAMDTLCTTLPGNTMSQLVDTQHLVPLKLNAQKKTSNDKSKSKESAGDAMGYYMTLPIIIIFIFLF